MEVRVATILCIFFFSFASAQTKSKQQYHKKLWDCDSLIKSIRTSPCNGLKLLSDSAIFSSHVDYICASNIWQFYGHRTAVHHYFNCDPVPVVSYESLNIGKSLYKMDLLFWMRHYGCPDSVALQSRHYGSFNKYEYEDIMQYYDRGFNIIPMDTTILWR